MKFKSIIALSVVVFSNSASAANWVTFPLGKPASLELLKIAGEQALLGSLVQGNLPDFSLAELSAECVVNVSRPALNEGFQTDEGNQIQCSWTATGNAQGGATFEIAQLPIAAWGHSLDRSPIKFDASFSKQLFEILKARFHAQPENPLYSDIQLCGPGGNCVEAYVINREADKNAAGAIVCNEDTTNGQITHNQCILFSESGL